VKEIKIYTTIILSAVLYECESWSLTFENRALRRLILLSNRRQEKTT